MITSIIIKNIGEIKESKYRAINPESDEAGYSSKITYPEDNFTIEIRDLIKKYTAYLENNFETEHNIYKHIADRIKNKELLRQFEVLCNNTNGMKPDLIIHKSQKDQNPNNQIFAMECKITPRLNYSDFKYDLFKLMIYKEILNFQENLYLIANNKNSKIAEFLETYQSERKFFSDSGILILNIEEYGAVPELIFSNF